MSRFIACAALAALMVGCSDAPVAPKSLHATGPSFLGTPPPPPVTGDGIGSFSASNDVDALAAVAVSCNVATQTQYQFVYTTDASTESGMQQIAHIKFDADLSHQITIHQMPHEDAVVDAEGMIVGPGFSFRIATTEPGSTLSPAHFLIFVTGVLKTADGSCDASAQFSGDLTPTPSP